MRVRILLPAFLLFTFLSVTSYAQEGPRPKRARVPADYQSGTLKELAAKAAQTSETETMFIDSDLSPTRVRATYAELTARTPEDKAELIRKWAQRYAGAPETYKPYEVDVAFKEDSADYWLTFKQKTLESFWKADVLNKPVDLFLIKMGAIKRAGKWVPVLLVENFQEVK
ncbi:MAG TPA: hypothetical protein VFS76_26000 [Pyrinomonadaceae bacterium]|nr:hypothetical protein [Pyrinomonadaceae bacterium]